MGALRPVHHHDSIRDDEPGHCRDLRCRARHGGRDQDRPHVPLRAAARPETSGETAIGGPATSAA